MNKVPHRGGREESSSIYMHTHIPCVKRLRSKESFPRTRHRRPAGSAWVLGLGGGPRAQDDFFLDQVKLNILPFISEKNNIQFYLKR